MPLTHKNAACPLAALMDGWDVRGVAVDPQPKFGDPQRADIDDQPKKE